MPKIITIPYKPHDLQRRLHEDTHRFKTIVCGRRFGKTVYAANKLIKKSCKLSAPYLYLAPTRDQGKEIMWSMLKFYMPKELIFGKPNESDLIINLINGSFIKLGSSEEPDRHRGKKYAGIICDEFADFKKARETFEAILSPTLMDYRGWCDFLGTPKGKMSAFYEMFIKDAEYHDPSYLDSKGEPIAIDPDFKSFRFKSADNPYMPQDEIERARKSLAPQYFRQEYEASFENYTGLIYKEFDINKHIIKREDVNLPEWANVYVGIDTGRFTSVSFVTIDDKGIAYLFDEIYDYDGIVANICQMIVHKLAQNRINKDKVMFIIDSASQVKQEYKYNGIHAYDAKKDIENQIALIRNRFSSNTLYFCDNCKMHIIEHQAYIWDEKTTKVQPKDENDHSCNSTQYIFSTYQTYKSVDGKKIEEYKKTLEYAATQKDYDSSEAFW